MTDISPRRNGTGMQYVVVQDPGAQRYFNEDTAHWLATHRARPLQTMAVKMFVGQPAIRYTVVKLEPIANAEIPPGRISRHGCAGVHCGDCHPREKMNRSQWLTLLVFVPNIVVSVILNHAWKASYWGTAVLCLIGIAVFLVEFKTG